MDLRLSYLEARISEIPRRSFRLKPNVSVRQDDPNFRRRYKVRFLKRRRLRLAHWQSGVLN